MVHTDLIPFFSRTFPGQITFFKGFLSTQFDIPGTCNQPLMQFKNPKDDTVTRCSHRLFCLCFSLFEYNLSALSPKLETSIVLSHHWHNAFRLSALTARTQPLYWGSRFHFLLYKHWPSRPFDAMTQENSLCTRPIRNRLVSNCAGTKEQSRGSGE